MTKTWSNVYLGASISLVLLTGCTPDADGSDSGAPRTDAGSSQPDAGAQSNELSDGVTSSDAGSGGQASAGQGGQSAGGAGGMKAPAAPSGGRCAPSPGHTGGAGGIGEDSDAGRDPNLICTRCGACDETQAAVSTMHTNAPVDYPDPPPSSGTHNPCWGTWGVHDEPLAAERWVHNLEHGGVVFLYNCPDGCADELSSLVSFANARMRTVVTAYYKLPTRFAVVAWEHRLVSECLDEQAFGQFYDAHVNRAPESNNMPPNPSCPP